MTRREPTRAATESRRSLRVFRKVRPAIKAGGKKKLSQELDPGMVLQSIDSEEIVVVEKGKRRRMTKAEIDFRQQFAKAIRGDLKAARLIANTAAKYFAPETKGPSETEFIIVPDAAFLAKPQ